MHHPPNAKTGGYHARAGERRRAQPSRWATGWPWPTTPPCKVDAVPKSSSLKIHYSAVARALEHVPSVIVSSEA